MSRLVAGREGDVLIVEPDVAARALLRRAAEQAGRRVREFERAEEAMNSDLTRGPPALAIVDLASPDRHGLELMAGLRGEAETHGTPLLVVTPRDPTSSERESMDGALANLKALSFDLASPPPALIGDAIRQARRLP